MPDVLIIEGEPISSAELARHLEDRGVRVRSACTAADGIAEAWRRSPHLVLLGVRLPDGSGLEVLDVLRREDASLPVLMIVASGSLEEVAAAIRRGATDVVEAPIDAARVGPQVHRALEDHAERYEPDRLRPEDAAKALVGEAPGLVSILEQIGRLRDASLSAGERPAILLTGETGVGKGHLALAIHGILGGGPFVEIDCTSAPSDHGIRIGLFEAARGGTLLLDDVGALDGDGQAAFLGLIERRARPTGLQIVASTNGDLESAVTDGDFRADLFHRLRVLSFDIPPLRERGDDVLRLARHFGAEFAARYRRQIRIDEDAEPILRSHAWPGNVRELRSTIERALLLEPSGTLGREVFRRVLPSGADGEARAGPALEGLDLRVVEPELIRRALRETDGNRTRAARLLGLSRYSLRYRMKKWGIH